MLKKKLIDNKTYGKHISLRITELTNDAVLCEELMIENLLNDLIDNLKIKKLAGPLFGSVNHSENENGISAIVLIQESHIAIHTYIERSTIFFDMFSCKDFDEKEVIAILSNHIGSFKIIESNIYNRGRHWNANIDDELANWINNR